MISAPIGQLMSQLNMTNVPNRSQPETEFQSSLRSVAESGPETANETAFIRTTTSLTDVQDFIDELEPLKDWKHFVFGRTENGKYEYVSVAIPDRDVTSDGYVPGPFRDHMTGFNYDRLHPSHPDAMNMKYIAGRVFEQIDVCRTCNC